MVGAGNHLKLMSLPSQLTICAVVGGLLDRSHGLAGVRSFTGEISMKMTRVLGLAGIGAVLALATPAQQAQALSLANPATVQAIHEGSKATTTEVHWHHRHWHHHHRHW
jgi:hypothetical protein